MENEIIVKFHISEHVSGFGSFDKVIKMMDSIKDPNHTIVLPIKFRIVGYNYEQKHNNYKQVIFEIAPVEDIKMDDLIK